MESTAIRVGVSACIVGEKVRFDAGHKRSQFVTEELAPYFEFVSVCPEVEMGLPVPRPTIRLVSNEERIALVETKDASRDHTDTLLAFSEAKSRAAAAVQPARLYRLRQVTDMRNGKSQSVQRAWCGKRGSRLIHPETAHGDALVTR